LTIQIDADTRTVINGSDMMPITRCDGRRSKCRMLGSYESRIANSRGKFPANDSQKISVESRNVVLLDDRLLRDIRIEVDPRLECERSGRTDGRRIRDFNI